MQNTQLQISPFWIFWIGVLTGALAIGLLFTYQTVQNQSLENAIIKSLGTKTQTIESGPDMASASGPDM